ncbi:S41 family peptidase [Candidatus Saccharibacteria bacterium]|nr:S41 family peptidase [Candidatus Saccharibacteria bacterium]
MNNFGDFQKTSPVKKKKWPWIIGGFTSILVAFGLFYFGILVGSGQVSLSFNRGSIQANQDLPNRLNYDSVNEVYRTLKQKYDGKLDEEKLILGLKKGLVEAAGDPHTTFLDAEQAADLEESLNGSFSGIGAELGKDNEYITVVAPIAGSPAEKAGLRPKDIIVTIDDKDAVGMPVDEAVNKIRGPEGTKVKLGVVRGQEKLTFDIVRETITIASVESKVLDGNIGYIKISRFADDTSKLTTEAANDFKSKNVSQVVLDVRSNPGGYLNSAVDVSCLWLKKGQTVLEEKRGGVVIKDYNCQQTGVLNGTKTVVLINEGSASASEITAGALKDNGAATIIGTKSYGKGSVQEMTNMPGGNILKVTVARWFTPNGKNIDKEGIMPDKNVELTDENIKNQQDPQLDEAIILLKQ